MNSVDAPVNAYGNLFDVAMMDLFDANWGSKSGGSACCALLDRLSDVIQSLLSTTKGDIDQLNSQGRTPLCVSVSFNASDVIRSFLDNGANLNFVDGEGNNLFHFATYNRRQDVHALLWSRTSEPEKMVLRANNNGMTPIQTACILSNVSFVKLLVEKLPPRDLSTHVDSKQRNLHHYVALGESGDRTGVREITELLLQAGVDFLQENIHGNTPSCYTYSNVCTNMKSARRISWVTSSCDSADVGSIRRSPMTNSVMQQQASGNLLQQALSQKEHLHSIPEQIKTSSVEALLASDERGRSLLSQMTITLSSARRASNAEDDFDRINTAAWQALQARCRSDDRVRFPPFDRDQSSPLLLAAEIDNLISLSHMCSIFADPESIRDARGRNAVGVAAIAGSAKCLRYLADSGWRFDHVDAQGQKTWFWLLKDERWELLAELISHNALSLDDKCSVGKTLLDYASNHETPVCLKRSVEEARSKRASRRSESSLISSRSATFLARHEQNEGFNAADNCQGDHHQTRLRRRSVLIPFQRQSSCAQTVVPTTDPNSSHSSEQRRDDHALQFPSWSDFADVSSETDAASPPNDDLSWTSDAGSNSPSITPPQRDSITVPDSSGSTQNAFLVFESSDDRPSNADNLAFSLSPMPPVRSFAEAAFRTSDFGSLSPRRSTCSRSTAALFSLAAADTNDRQVSEEDAPTLSDRQQCRADYRTFDESEWPRDIGGDLSSFGSGEEGARLSPPKHAPRSEADYWDQPDESADSGESPSDGQEEEYSFEHAVLGGPKDDDWVQSKELLVDEVAHRHVDFLPFLPTEDRLLKTRITRAEDNAAGSSSRHTVTRIDNTNQSADRLANWTIQTGGVTSYHLGEHVEVSVDASTGRCGAEEDNLVREHRPDDRAPVAVEHPVSLADDAVHEHGVDKMVDGATSRATFRSDFDDASNKRHEGHASMDDGDDDRFRMVERAIDDVLDENDDDHASTDESCFGTAEQVIIGDANENRTDADATIEQLHLGADADEATFQSTSELDEKKTKTQVNHLTEDLTNLACAFSSSPAAESSHSPGFELLVNRSTLLTCSAGLPPNYLKKSATRLFQSSFATIPRFGPDLHVNWSQPPPHAPAARFQVLGSFSRVKDFKAPAKLLQKRISGMQSELMLLQLGRNSDTDRPILSTVSDQDVVDSLLRSRQMRCSGSSSTSFSPTRNKLDLLLRLSVKVAIFSLLLLFLLNFPKGRVRKLS